MPRSSNCIAALASALAKAQAELVNPENSLTAILHDNRPGASGRSFRYAPLSSGLDIVRKTLGRHEIAIMQSTAVDSAAGMVNLTTTLAHASGEWIASDWPVCPLAETANPQRMGAALTYARRYALFTLVGIAGEDDLDAPDLDIASSGSAITHPTPIAPGVTAAGKRCSANGRALPGGQRSGCARPPILAPDDSARLREGMLAEIESITSSTAAVAWANTMLRSKNSLTADDARRVEAAFEAKFASWMDDLATLEPAPHLIPADSNSITSQTGAAEPPFAGDLGGPKLPIIKTVRRRNKEHIKFVRQQPCLICAKQPAEAHHLRFAQPRALGRKISDEYTVPLCRAHHREVHRASRELQWWQSHGVAPLAVANSLWQKSRSGQALSSSNGSSQKQLCEAPGQTSGHDDDSAPNQNA